MAVTGGTIQVRVAAEVSTFARDMQRATSEVNRFARSTKDVGQGLRTIGTATSTFSNSLQSLAYAVPSAALGTFAGAISRGTIVMGEAVTMSGQLTKGFTAVAAAGRLVVATLGPVGMVTAGIIALTGAIVGLVRASKDMANLKAGPVGDELLASADVQQLLKGTAGRRQRAKDVAMGFGRPLGTISVAAAPMAPSERTDVALAQWKDALAGIRPITDQIVVDWNDAMRSINAALSNTTLLTRSEVTELYRMRAALKEIQSVTAPMTTSEVARQINTGGLLPTEKMFGHGLDPAKVLGDQFKNPLAGLDLSILKKPDLLEKGFGKLLSIGGGVLAGMFTGGISTLIGGGIGSLLGGLFGRRRRVVDDTADEFARLNRELRQVNESISNLPVGVKIANYRHGAADPDRSVARTFVVNVDELHVNTDNAEEFLAKLSSMAEKSTARGGTSGFRLATNRGSRGV